MREDVTSRLVLAIVEGELDLAIVALPISDERLESESLLTEKLLLTLPPSHPLAHRRRLAIQDLVSERFILLGEMHCLGEQVLSFCNAHECHPQIACHTAQISTIQSLISLNQGVSLLPEMSCRSGPSRSLVYRTLGTDQPRRTIAVAWHRHHYHSPLAERFLVELRRWASSGAPSRSIARCTRDYVDRSQRRWVGSVLPSSTIWELCEA